MAHSYVTRPLLALLLVLSASPAPQAAEDTKKRSHSSETAKPNSVAAQTKQMTVWQARKAVVTGLRTVMTKTEFNWGAGYIIKMHPDSIRVSAESIECAADTSEWGFGTKPNPQVQSCEVNLNSIGVLEVKRFRSQYELRQNGKHGVEGFLGYAAWVTPGEAQAFADAVNRLSSSARGEDRELLEADRLVFQQEAAAWRALAVKPAISEDVRRHRLLAENAVQERQFETAVEEYEAGLELNPVWPEGHFNAALLCAGLGYYSEAIHHMRAYLELVPDAQDAQQARDQIVIWEAKLNGR
jgi:tetratricopeptide (TPR) repeat protein